MGHLGRIKSQSKGRLGIPHAGKTYTLNDMTNEDKDARDFAHQAYEQPEERAATHKGYVLDKDLSDKTTAVYHNPETKKNYIGFRGTADLKDLYTANAAKSAAVNYAVKRATTKKRKPQAGVARARPRGVGRAGAARARPHGVGRAGARILRADQRVV